MCCPLLGPQSSFINHLVHETEPVLHPSLFPLHNLKDTTIYNNTLVPQIQMVIMKESNIPVVYFCVNVRVSKLEANLDCQPT